MSAETEEVLRKVRTVRNKAERGELTQKATRILPYAERQAMHDEMRIIESSLGAAPEARQAITKEGLRNLARRRNYITKSLNESSPPTDLSGETRNALLKRERELAAEIRESMPLAEVMRRNPAGAVDWHVKWERKNKDKILEWKNIRRMNNPEDDSQDLANVEMLRPSMLMPKGASTFMPDAQIKGYMSYGHVADQVWEDTFGNIHAVNSPYERAKAAEAEDKNDAEVEARENEAVQMAMENQSLKEKVEELEKKLGVKAEKAEMVKAARRLNIQKAREAKKRNEDERRAMINIKAPTQEGASGN